MSGPRTGPGRRLAAAPPAPSGALVPSLLLRHGRICRPGADGPEFALGADGAPLDPFDVIDRLVRDYTVLYLVDLDGIERSEPQLDYIQEFSRDIALWVDGGVRSADQSIDILVAGAQRAVISSAMLDDPGELERAWGLSTELAFEIAFEGGEILARPEWAERDPAALARTVRGIGLEHVILSPRDRDPDWSLVRTISSGGPTWVDGTFLPRDASRLKETGAAGGIFHIDAILDENRPIPSPDIPRPSPTPRRDDED
ncbi:MAG: HisA/HisF-related TIM barrel protein [Thermoplasmata archaeon]